MGLCYILPGRKGPRMSQSQIIYDIENLTKQYQAGETVVDALRGVTLQIRAGELLVLLGPSGSGKSTFLNILGGLDTPTSGQIFFQEQALGQMTEGQLTQYRRHHIGFVFQAYNLVPSLTAEENVALVTDIADAPMEPATALEVVGLAKRRHHFPAQLSGGEQQRVAIARAIAKNPAVLLCDEPTGALDQKTGVVVLEALEQINREFNTTVAIITHNAAIAHMADRVIGFIDGRVGREERNAQRLSPAEIKW